MSSKLPNRVGRPRKHTNDRERWNAAQRARRSRLSATKSTKSKQNALFSSRTSEWYTPPEIYQPVLCSLGREQFDCDPASPSLTGPIPAQIRFTRKEDGLKQAWYGVIWLNPPYGRQLTSWIQKAITEIRAGRAEIIYLLVPARTDTAWWHDAVAAGATAQFLKGRIRFLKENGTVGDTSPFPSVLLRFHRSPQDSEREGFLDDGMATTPQSSSE